MAEYLMKCLVQSSDPKKGEVKTELFEASSDEAAMSRMIEAQARWGVQPVLSSRGVRTNYELFKKIQ